MTITQRNPTRQTHNHDENQSQTTRHKHKKQKHKHLTIIRKKYKPMNIIKQTQKQQKHTYTVKKTKI